MFSESGKRVVIFDRAKKKGLSLYRLTPHLKTYKQLISLMVPEVGIEPTCPCERGILSPLRLPVSPLRHGLRLLIGEIQKVKLKSIDN